MERSRTRSSFVTTAVLGALLVGTGLASSSASAAPEPAPRSNQASRKAEPARKKITLDLMDADIRNVIRLIADVSGLNIVVGDDVQGKVTMKLKNIPWDEALEVILKTKGLGMKWEGKNIVRIAPQALLDEERRQALDAADDCVKRGPLKTRVIPVNYARAADLVPIVKETLTERGRVTYDERTNVIIVKDAACSPAFSAVP